MTSNDYKHDVLCKQIRERTRTVQEIAREARVSRQQIYRVLKGENTDAETLVRICRAVFLDPQEIIPDTSLALLAG